MYQTPSRAPQFGQNIAADGIWNWQFGQFFMPAGAGP